MQDPHSVDVRFWVKSRHCNGSAEYPLYALRWDDIDLATGRLHVRRAKSGDASVHPISARESRALRKLLREAPTSPYVFISERRAPLSAAGYQRMVARAGVAAKFTFLVHSHMLRHACGYYAGVRVYGRALKLTTAFPCFECGANIGMYPGRVCSIFGACQISRSSIATSTPQNAPSRRGNDEPHCHLKLN